MLQRTFLSLMLLVALVPRATGQQPRQRPTTEPPKPATAQPEAESQDVVKITTNLVQVDGYGAPGSSGSPIFDRTGRVAAVLYGGNRESQGKIIYAVPAAAIIAYLKQLDTVK